MTRKCDKVFVWQVLGMAIFLFAAVIFFSMSGWAAPDKIESFDFGPVHFNVPDNYIVSFFPPHGSDTTASVSIEASLPDMKPVPPEELAHPKPGTGFGEHVLITIFFNDNLPTDEMLLQNYQRQIDKDISPMVEESYDTWPMNSTNRMLYISKNNIEPKFFICETPQKGIFANIKLSCEVNNALKTDMLPKNEDGLYPLVLTYEFSKDHVADVASINTKVLKFVQSLMQ